jgi:hypothetical protein
MPPFVVWLSIALFLLNAAVVSRLFQTEYLSQTGTGEGATISYARYARDHWPDLGWCPFWYAGLPFRNAYVPGLHLTVAAYSALRRISAAAAFHQVVAFLYSLGPVTLFWMALRFTGSVGWSLGGGLLYSLISPSAFLVPDIRRDLGSLFWAQRLHSMVGYSDNPHVAALTLVPLAILLLDVALERRRPAWYVAAALALAAVPLTNWPGAIGLGMAIAAYAFTLGPGWGRKWAATAGIAALAYGLAVTWIPPSTIIRTQADTQTFEPANRFGPHHLMYLAVVTACTLLLLKLFSAARVPRYLRFFVLFFFYAAAPVLGRYWLGVTLLAQPHRFHLEMEMGFILSLVFGMRPAAGRWRVVRKPLGAALAVLCVVQFAQYRSYARRLIRSIDITQTSEYKTARWFDQHMRNSRVMVPGSTSFWFNAFTDTPQLTGCCPQGVLNQTIVIANYGINTDLTAENRAFENTMLWFKALGVHAVAVSGPRSTEVYKPFYHPAKFVGRLPVLWREGDDVIYEVPWRYYSLAHAMETGDLVQRAPAHGVDTAPLVPYVEAIERPEAPQLQMRWLNNETIVISGNLEPSQIVSIQVTASTGWHATVDGSPRAVYPDKLGFLTVVPRCSGGCTIRMYYDGGMEMRIARWLNRAAIAGALLWVASTFIIGLEVG